MKQTIYLTVAGFNNDRLILKKPNGDDVAITLDQFAPDDLSTITTALAMPVPNWNDSGPAPVQVIGDVEIDDATGKYISIAIMGIHIKND